jgi:hypothetical protein
VSPLQPMYNQDYKGLVCLAPACPARPERPSGVPGRLPRGRRWRQDVREKSGP